MSILSKVIIGLILVTAIPFFVLAAIALRTHERHRQDVAKIETQIDQLRDDTRLKVHGDAQTPGIDQLQISLSSLVGDRKRVWYGCGPSPNATTAQIGSASVLIPPATATTLLIGTATVQVPPPDITGLIPGMVIYVFEESPPAGQAANYLGEFTVASVDEAQRKVELVPTMQFTPFEIERVTKSASPTWTLCEVMPADRHNYFADDQLAAVMPNVSPAVLDEYRRDGDPANPNDPADRVVDGKFERPLNDFAEANRILHADLARLRDQIVAATLDKATLQNALKLAQDQGLARQKEIDGTLRPELARLTAERDVIQARLAEFKARLSAAEADLAATSAANKDLARQWARLQFDLATQIDSAAAAAATN